MIFIVLWTILQFLQINILLICKSNKRNKDTHFNTGKINEKKSDTYHTLFVCWHYPVTNQQRITKKQAGFGFQIISSHPSNGLEQLEQVWVQDQRKVAYGSSGCIGNFGYETGRI